MIILHVIAALTALVISSYNLFALKEKLVKISYAVAVVTLASGVLLIFLNHANIIRTCLAGIAFFSVVSVLNEITRRKLATQPGQ